jgi:hypothetical protein
MEQTFFYLIPNGQSLSEDKPVLFQQVSNYFGHRSMQTVIHQSRMKTGKQNQLQHAALVLLQMSFC